MFFDIGIMVATIILASGAYKYIEQRTRGSIPSAPEKRINARMDELDRRLTDIQDILITIDEKLSRKY